MMVWDLLTWMGNLVNLRVMVLSMVVIIVPWWKCLHNLHIALWHLNWWLQWLRVNFSMHCHQIYISFNAQVLLWISFLTQHLSSIGMFIYPLQSIDLWIVIIQQSWMELCNWSHLGIQEGIPQQQLLTLEEAVLIWNFSPFLCLRTLTCLVESTFVSWKLMYECCSDF